MGLDRNTSSDESGGNLGADAELSYHIWPSISSGEIRVSDFFPKLKYSEQKSEFLLSPEEMLDHM